MYRRNRFEEENRSRLMMGNLSLLVAIIGLFTFLTFLIKVLGVVSIL